MDRIIQYIRNNRFIQILLVLAIVIIAIFGIYRLNHIHMMNERQAAYEQLARDMQENRVELSAALEAPEGEERVPSEPEGASVEPDAAEEPAAADVIETFLEIEGYRERYGEYVLNGVPDFTLLQEMNQDIAAYLFLPDSVIDYPVLRSEDNTYYLDHNLDGSAGYPGCLYIENMNRPDFHDPVTVIYGHHLTTGGMFSELDKFLDAEYMENHRYYFLYLPDEIQIYEIVLAAKYSSQHLLVSRFYQAEDGLYHFNGFEGNEGKLIYDRIEAFGLEGNYVSEHAPAETDRMIYWSTCLPARNRRMIVGARQITAENIAQLSEMVVKCSNRIIGREEFQ